jgi:hypothetical protein
MTMSAIRLVKLCVAVLPLLVMSPAFAQATRTWVSGVGDDANPCSRTAPCKTYAGAISKTAAGGEISTLDPGGYGAVTITKSITISGDNTLASILSSGTNGIIVNAGPSDVVIIRGISINGASGAVAGLNGIRFIAGGELHVENVTIYDITQQGILFNPSGSSALFVNNTTIRNAAGGALLIQPTGTGTAIATLNRVAMEGNGRGLRAEDGSTVIVRDSHATGNDANGFVGLGTSRSVDMTLENCVSSNNVATGVYAGALTTVTLSNVTVTRNGAGLQAVGGGGIVSFGNNRVTGNTINNGPPSSTIGQM